MSPQQPKGITAVHVWCAVLVMCGTVSIGFWRTAQEMGEKAGEANSNLRQLNQSVQRLEKTTGEVVTEQHMQALRLQHLEDTVPHRELPRLRPRTVN
jgi:hypothetical protein